MTNFFSWFSRLRSSSKCLYENLRTPNFHNFRTQKNAPTTNVMDFERAKKPWMTWSSSVLHLALAVSAGSLAFQPQFNPSLCDASNSNNRLASTRRVAKAGWFLGLGDHKKLSLPDVVKAGDPVLHEPAQEVNPDEISSERIQKIIDDMIKVMRKAPGVGLAAPQIGIPLRAPSRRTKGCFINVKDRSRYVNMTSKYWRSPLMTKCLLLNNIIVLEYTTEYISYAPKEEIKAQERRPFDLLVILNPKLEKRSDRTALFFEGCLSVDGFRAAVE